MDKRRKDAASKTPVLIPLCAAAIIPTDRMDIVRLTSVGGALTPLGSLLEVIKPMYSSEH